MSASIIDDSSIMVSAQDVGKVYDFKSTPEEEGKYFNHQWEDLSAF